MSLKTVEQAEQVKKWLDGAGKVAEIGSKGSKLLGQPEAAGVFEGVSVALKVIGTAVVLADAWSNPLSPNDVRLDQFQQLGQRVDDARTAIQQQVADAEVQRRLDDARLWLDEARTRLVEPEGAADAYLQALRDGSPRHVVRGRARALLDGVPVEQVCEVLTGLARGAGTRYLPALVEATHGDIVTVRDQAAAVDLVAVRAAALIALIGELKVRVAREELDRATQGHGLAAESRSGHASRLHDVVEAEESLAEAEALYRQVGQALDDIARLRQHANRQLSACVADRDRHVRAVLDEVWRGVAAPDDPAAEEERYGLWADRVRAKLERHWPFLDVVVVVWSHAYNWWVGFPGPAHVQGWTSHEIRRDPAGAENRTHLVVAWAPRLGRGRETPLVCFPWTDPAAAEAFDAQVAAALDPGRDAPRVEEPSAGEHAWRLLGTPVPGPLTSAELKARAAPSLVGLARGSAKSPVPVRLAGAFRGSGVLLWVIYADYGDFPELFDRELVPSVDSAPYFVSTIAFEPGVEIPRERCGPEGCPAFAYRVAATDADRAFLWGPARVNRRHGGGADWTQVAVVGGLR